MRDSLFFFTQVKRISFLFSKILTKSFTHQWIVSQKYGYTVITTTTRTANLNKTLAVNLLT